MIQSVIATVRVRAGAEADFEAIAKKLVAATNAEPGCLLYTLNKGEEPQTYVFMERYQDEEAVKAHRASDHFRSIGREMGAYMEGDRSVLRMQEVAGP
jgi:quinol monooxygenase YgiN